MISLPVWTATLISMVAIALIIFATWAYLTAQRLHRLHKRCEQAALALEGALDRRALAARTVARSLRRAAAHPGVDTAQAEEIRTAAATIRHAAHIVEGTACPQLLDLREREIVENDLTLALGRANLSSVEHEDIAGLQEAAVRVNLARRFYNNAVREALAVQTAPLVRFFHLAGHAPAPHFFNIIDESWSETEPHRSADGLAPTPSSAPTSIPVPAPATTSLSSAPASSSPHDTNSVHAEED